MTEVNDGARELLNTIIGKQLNPNALPFDPDASVTQALYELEYADPSAFSTMGTETVRSTRARVRYLAALWPDANITELTHRIHGVLNNKLFTVEDLRLVLMGRSLSDPTKRTQEIPLATIQTIGRLLKSGAPLTMVAEQSRTSVDTVRTIEDYLGISNAIRLQRVDRAIAAARAGVGTRRLAKELQIPKTSAQRLLVKAKQVLRELGEIK